MSAEMILKVGAVLGALATIVGMGWKIFSWINAQKVQEARINDLEKKVEENKKACEDEIETVRNECRREVKSLSGHHDNDLRGVSEELTLIIQGLQACLKVMAKQSADPTIDSTVAKIDEYITAKAHEK